jgi:uncharacterized protein (TIGR03643 family)
MASIKKFSKADVARIIEMAWEDRTSLDAILRVYGLNESDLKLLMKKELKPRSYSLWRE